MLLTGRIGTRWMWPPYSTTWSFCPARIRIAVRTARGITTWNFGDTVTTPICISLCLSINIP
jgi:hypothetical protein